MKIKRVTKKALKAAITELNDDMKSYRDAYSFWFGRILNLTDPPFPRTLKELTRWQEEYDFAVRITVYYSSRFKEIGKQIEVLTHE